MDSLDNRDSPLAQFQHYNELLLLLEEDCDADDSDSLCLPPLFDLPPPPPPPWLEMPPLCDNCDSVPDVTSVNNVQDIFKTVIIIAVMSISVVISIITIVIILRRRLASRDKNTSAENLTSVTPDKQVAGAGAVAGNYYTRVSRDTQIIVDQRGRTLLLPGQLVMAGQLGGCQADQPMQPIYETIDSDVYSEHYADPRAVFLTPRGHQEPGPVSLYENPDASLYNPNTTFTDASSTLYQDVDIGDVRSHHREAHPTLHHQGYIFQNMTTATGQLPAKTEVRLQSYQPYHISPL